MNLYELSIKKGFANTHQLFAYIKNKQLKTVRHSLASGHNYPAKFKTGDLVASGHGNNNINGTTSISNIEYNNIGSRTGKSGIYLVELEIYGTTKADLIVELADIKESSKKQIDDLEEKINILEELGMEEYNEKLISIVSAVGVINKDAKPKEKLQLAEALMVALDK